MTTDSLIGTQRTIPLDAEHFGVRLIVPVVTLLACVGTYWLGLQISSAAGNPSAMVLIVLPVSIAISLGAAWGVERLAKRYWPSGRRLIIDDAGVVLHERNGSTTRLNWDQHVNVLSWRFTVPPRRGRVPKGWKCLACQLVQDEISMIFYTFMKPDDAEALPAHHAFMLLAPRKELQESGGLLKSGIQARLHTAEQLRWEFGAEMIPGDFAELVQMMGARVKGWPDAGDISVAAFQALPDTYERPAGKGDGKPIQL
ncbi:MAG: hypothetical protein JXB47_18135 [Anaerolineae bacterium]|nr:hypothetical protein [Anaerolineae bacterium]